MRKNTSSYNYNTYRFNSKTIAIIGIDGSGKSTCFRQLFQNLSVPNFAAIGDKVIIKKNNKRPSSIPWLVYIKEFLGKHVKTLKNRKVYRILKFLELILRVKLLYIIDRRYAPKLIITDGSPLINMLGWGHYYCSEIYCKEVILEVIGYMTGNKIPEHRRAFFKKHSPEILLLKRFGIQFHIPDRVFFLKVDPASAVERIQLRNEELQPHETAEFLKKLQEAYIMVCELLTETKLTYINTNNVSIDAVSKELIDSVDVSNTVNLSL